MKQGVIVKAYKALTKIGQQDLPIRLAYDLFRIKQALQPQWDFQLAEEGKAIAEARKEANGDIAFETPEAADACRRRLAELAGINVDLKVTPAQIPLSTPGLKLSMEDIDALSTFVKFTK